MKETMIEGARAGRIEVNEGQFPHTVNVDGKQVCDFFAFNRANIGETLSPGHQRPVTRCMFLQPGDMLYSFLRRPLFVVIEDPIGCNDFSLPACDAERYRMDFAVEGHSSCRTNLEEVTRDLSIPYESLPGPFNFFQPTPVQADDNYGTATSPAKSRDRINLRALTDVIAVGSSCPQVQIPLNNFNPSRLKLVVCNA